MDAITFLRQDHKSVLGLFETLDGAPSGSGAEASGLETVVNNLIIAESQHEAIEEQFFWPAVRDAIGDGIVDKAIEQEQAGKQLLQRLEDGKPGEADYHEALQEFIKAGREHIAYEQDVVWRKSSWRSAAKIWRRSAKSSSRQRKSLRPAPIRIPRPTRRC